ncbi:MAG: hypothetical protein FWG98_00015 [Candidatus Cloacimonetes bacterium]|nr:hypothetical protein [Candidatus Cloacimonadota bacterium]
MRDLATTGRGNSKKGPRNDGIGIATQRLLREAKININTTKAVEYDFYYLNNL